jgi:hypothetical protein
MFCAELGAMVWLLLATYLELPVSSTHSISEWQVATCVDGCMGLHLRCVMELGHNKTFMIMSFELLKTPPLLSY